MADRPRGKGGPDEGSPEYHWLYGSRTGSDPSSGTEEQATRAVPRSQADQRAARPDETRMMPAMPRQGAGERQAAPAPRGSTAARDSAGGAGRGDDPGRGSRRGGGGRRPRGIRPRTGFRIVRWVLLLWLVFLVAVPFWAWSKVAKVDAEPDGERPGDQPGTTYLLVGGDSRGDLTPEQRADLGTGNAESRLADTIMLLHTGSGPNLLMSIPRDSIVDIPGRGTSKINASYAYGGPELLVETIESNTGIRVDHYVEIGFGGFVGMVDAVGGVEICPKQAMKDPQANLDVEAGCQEADGKTALGYARSRKTYTQLGDIDRARAQREVVSAVGGEAVSPWTVVNPLRYFNLASAAAESFTVSEGSSPLAIGRFGLGMTRVNGDNGLTCGIPIRDTAVNWDEERSRQMFEHIISDDTDGIPKGLCTPSGLPR